ncbi:response regulator [Deinococcus oregonensis]|uniref:Response regulator n=1 Tax=Deinococcus oregonensis TaxID=1805970 RepID=A0ABV6AYS8_9DEIO
MLVDDSFMDRELAREAFALMDPDTTLMAVESGSAALALLNAPAAVLPDVVLLDINMPGMNGFDVLQALKQQPRLHLLPVVMLSTSSSEHDITHAYSLHASGYIVKSVAFQPFIDQVDTFLAFWKQALLTASAPLVFP